MWLLYKLGYEMPVEKGWNEGSSVPSVPVKSPEHLIDTICVLGESSNWKCENSCHGTFFYQVWSTNSLQAPF